MLFYLCVAGPDDGFESSWFVFRISSCTVLPDGKLPYRETQKIKTCFSFIFLKGMGNTRLLRTQFQSHACQPSCYHVPNFLNDFQVRMQQSGSQGALLPLSPLRTGRVPLKTSGSSTSRTTRLFVL